jgi:hypothetical protein
MFSETVDAVVSRSGRTNKLLEIVDFVNITIRQIHVFKQWYPDVKVITWRPTNVTRSSQNHLHLHQQHSSVIEKYKQGQFLYDRESGTKHGFHGIINDFRVKKPRLINKINSVVYDDHCVPSQMQPGSMANKLKHYYYLLGDEIHFYGHMNKIEMWYSTWSPHFGYYPAGSRPAIYSRPSDTWVYLQATPHVYSDEPLSNNFRDLERQKVASWLLKEWQEVVIAGAMMQLYESTDDARKKEAAENFARLLESMARSVQIVNNLNGH